MKLYEMHFAMNTDKGGLTESQIRDIHLHFQAVKRLSKYGIEYPIPDGGWREEEELHPQLKRGSRFDIDWGQGVGGTGRVVRKEIEDKNNE